MKRLSFTMFVLLAASGITLGQESANDLDIFGYWQATFDNSSETTAIMQMPATTVKRNTFILQQANLFFRKQFGAKFTSFVDLEFTQTYSSFRGWGSFRVEEAWMRYDASREFNIKAGLLVPVFNNLNEVKNRMPLMPYVVRPVVYESAAAGLASSDEFVPQSAYLQIQGELHTTDVIFDYAIYTGNGDPSYSTTGSPTSQYLIGGTDTTSTKLVGGRIGLRFGKQKAGVSFTYDRANLSNAGLSSVPRRRIGADVSLQAAPLALDAELISVRAQLDESQLRQFHFVGMMNPLLGTEAKSFFGYFIATYDISDEVYAFVGGEYDEFHASSITRGYMAGGGYRPIDQVVVKLQYLRLENTIHNLSSYQADRVEVAISMMF
jgi:hypothetical protein